MYRKRRKLFLIMDENRLIFNFQDHIKKLFDFFNYEEYLEHFINRIPDSRLKMTIQKNWSETCNVYCRDSLFHSIKGKHYLKMLLSTENVSKRKKE